MWPLASLWALLLRTNHSDFHTHQCRSLQHLQYPGAPYRVDRFSADDPNHRCSHSDCQHRLPDCHSEGPWSVSVHRARTSALSRPGARM